MLNLHLIVVLSIYKADEKISSLTYIKKKVTVVAPESQICKTDYQVNSNCREKKYLGQNKISL